MNNWQAKGSSTMDCDDTRIREWNAVKAAMARIHDEYRTCKEKIEGVLQADGNVSLDGAKCLSRDTVRTWQDIVQNPAYLPEFGLKADYSLQKLEFNSRTSWLQMCAWDNAVEGSTVSGCLPCKTLKNNSVTVAVDGKRRVPVPMLLQTVSKRHGAISTALEKNAVINDAFTQLGKVFQFSGVATIQLSDDVMPTKILTLPNQSSHVRLSMYRYTVQANEYSEIGALSLSVQHNVVTYHENVHDNYFVSESLYVQDRLKDNIANFTTSNYDPFHHTPGESHIEKSVPVTAAHVFGLGEMLVGGSKNDMLSRDSMDPSRLSVLNAVTVLASLRNQVTRESSNVVAQKASETLLVDPGLKNTHITIVAECPGLRVVQVELNAMVSKPKRIAWVVLTSVLECKDFDVTGELHGWHMSTREHGKTSVVDAVHERNGTVVSVQPGMPNVKRMEKPQQTVSRVSDPKPMENAKPLEKVRIAAKTRNFDQAEVKKNSVPVQESRALNAPKTAMFTKRDEILFYQFDTLFNPVQRAVNTWMRSS